MATTQQLSAFRRNTAALRVLPDFVIIGAQKAGTSSLYHYLTQHPDVAPAARKEVHFFDWNYARGLNWYRGHFVTGAYRGIFQAATGRRLMVGEASPYYMAHPHAPGRLRTLLPEAKLIVLLRDPVDRTLSSYQHQVRRGRESLSLVEALDKEEERTASEALRIMREPAYNSEAHRRFSYLARGVYADQLPAWFSLFPRDRCLILRAEDFFENTSAVFNQVLQYLALRPWQPAAYRKFNAAEYDALDPATRRRLVEYFTPHNQRLYELVGRDFGWAR